MRRKKLRTGGEPAAAYEDETMKTRTGSTTMSRRGSLRRAVRGRPGQQDGAASGICSSRRPGRWRGVAGRGEEGAYYGRRSLRGGGRVL